LIVKIDFKVYLFEGVMGYWSHLWIGV